MYVYLTNWYYTVLRFSDVIPIYHDLCFMKHTVPILMKDTIIEKDVSLF